MAIREADWRKPGFNNGYNRRKQRSKGPRLSSDQKIFTKMWHPDPLELLVSSSSVPSLPPSFSK